MTKLESLISCLREKISNGEYAAGTRFPSEYELAEQYGVNKTTANKAVGALASEGWLTRGQPGAGTHVKTNLIFPKGVIVYLMGLQEFHAHLLEGAQRMAYARGYLVAYLHVPLKALDSCLEQLEHAKIAGVLCSSYGRLMANLPMPVVYVDESFADPTLHCVANDNRRGGRMIGESLVAKGHRSILYFSSDPHSKHMRLRRQGTLDVLANAGMTQPEKRVYIYENEFSCLKALRQAVERFPDFTAIVCDTDSDTLRMMNLLPKLGIEPAKISCAGFGHVGSIQAVMPITTIEQHPLEIGKQAADNLIDLIEGHPVAEELHMCDIELIEKGSIFQV